MRSSVGARRGAAVLLQTAARRSGFRAGQLVIDNGSGDGPQDYSSALLGDAAIEIRRSVNEPSYCTCDVLVRPGGLPVPQRRARVVVKSDAGKTLFTGYLATEPVREGEGAGCDSGMYCVQLHAVSDEWLLDKLGPALARSGELLLGLDVREAIERVTRQFGSVPLSMGDAGVSAAPLGVLPLAEVANWSAQAGAVASTAYANYRAQDGSITVQQAGSVVHAFSDADGTLSLADFRVSQMRELANDVTVSGEREPTSYVTDVFLAGGVETEFTLSEPAFQAADAVLLQDDFTAPALDTRVWLGNDPGGHLSITSAGLTMNGGNGVDGSTTLVALNAVEMGGSVLVEMRGVKLAANSVGVLGGLYTGDAALANCFAGFRVRQSSGTTIVVPLMNGVEVGTALSVVDGHSYTLRLRLHCAEVQRVMGRYNVMVEGVVQTFGDAAAVSAPMDVVFDVLDEGQGSANPATVLYDSATGGAVALTPATCVFAVVNAGQLFGSVGGVSLTRPGTVWVESTLPDGTKQTRLIGAPYTGADCSVSAGAVAGGAGTVKFFAGRTPVSGELIRARYRMSGRALARVADAASVAAEATTGVPGTSRWLGRVLQPPARSSADCEAAAQAVLAFSTSRSAALAGTYICKNPAADIWPGDVLRITRDGVTTALLVRSVMVSIGPGSPQTLRYKIAFANDWGTQLAEGLGLRLSEAIATDAALPRMASDGADVLASLGALQVVSVTETAITLDMGTDPPPGGGFELRRFDGGFGSGSEVDLVLRSPVRTFSIPRLSQVERYFVRMYDASVPPKWSRFSSAVFVDVPVG